MLYTLYSFQVIYQTADQIRESFLSHLMLLHESIKLFGEIGCQRTNVDLEFFVDSSVEVGQADVGLGMEGQELLLECNFNILSLLVTSLNNLADLLEEIRE